LSFDYSLTEIIEKIKATTRIEDVIAEDGIELRPRGRELVGYHGNKHGSNSKTSLTVDPTQGVYHCFNCGEGGDAITWLMKNRGMSFMEVLRCLASKSKAGIELPEMDPEEQKRQNELWQERQQLWDLYASAAEICHNMLGERERKLLLDKWGLTAETAEKFKFGFAPADGKFISKKLREKGFDWDLICRSGLVNKGGYDHFQGRLVFPYWRNGRVVYFIARRIEGITPEEEWEKAKFKKLLVYNESNHISKAVSNEYFCGEDTARGADELIITEGIADCYAAIQAGFSCISPVTVTFRKADFPRLAMLARRAKTVFICNDSEENRSGEKGALATAEYLESQGINIKLVQLPRPEGVEKVDLADYLKEHTAEDFRELMKQAKTLLELALDKLTYNPEDTETRQEAIGRIARLEDVDRDVYTAKLHQILKRLDVKKVTLEAAIKKAAKEQLEEQNAEGGEKNQQDLLIELAQEAELFKNEHREPFVRIPVDDHKEIWPVRSRDFKLWLTGKYYDKTGKGPNTEALNAALNTIAAQTWRSKNKHKLHVRVAWHDNCIYYDLANDKWQAVKITPCGWEVVNNPPILFRRYAHMLEQPLPDQNGSPHKLLDFVNIQSEENKCLYLVSEITDFVPDIPHVAKVPFGQQGSTKTTFSKVTRMIADPSAALTCRSYRDKKEFTQYLAHNYYCILDNLSSISPDLSDMLCSAITGDGDSKRALFTDDEDIIYVFKRCFVINGINNVVIKPDLLRRSILFELEPPVPEKRKEEAEFWKEFEQARPYILGGIFNALARAMEIYPSIKLTGLYDMADFTKRGAAIAEALGYGVEAFLQAYAENKARQTDEAIANNAVAAAIKAFMENKKEWTGTASELLGELEEIAESEKINTKAKGWPKAANSLSRKLNELKTTLQQAGIEMFDNRGTTKKRARLLTLQVNENTVQTVQTVQRGCKPLGDKASQTDDMRTICGRYADDIEEIPSNRKPLGDKASDDMDDADDIFSTFKGSGEISQDEEWEEF